MSDVVFDGVTKRFGEVAAVDDLSLHIVDGEFMVILGPSGCGKTTALRMIAGLDDISDGTLSIGGMAVNDVPPAERDIAMVFQSYALYPHMTVRRNIESPLIASRSRRVEGAEVTRRVEEAAAMLDLGAYLDRKPGELSGGQRQRVALARAIVRRPEVFLMDEPLSNLDAKLRTQTRAELVQLHRRLGTTLVYVTHDQVEAMTMADRIAIMRDGRLQQVDHPQAVYERPANLFVAGFIGTPPMNVIPAVARIADGRVSVEVAGVAFDVGPTFEGVSDGQAVVAGVRPEHLLVSGTGGLQVTVTVVESLGHERHLLCDLNGSSLIVRQSTDDPEVAVGETVRLEPSEAFHVFDAESTLRLGP